MRLVLDTNTALSALLWGGTPGRLIEAAEDGRVELASSAPLLAELQGVLSRAKFAKQLAARGLTVDDVFDGYAALVLVVTPATIAPTVTRDPADDQVLAAAVAAQADLIVSGCSSQCVTLARWILDFRRWRNIGRDPLGVSGTGLPFQSVPGTGPSKEATTAMPMPTTSACRSSRMPSRTACARRSFPASARRGTGCRRKPTCWPSSRCRVRRSARRCASIAATQCGPIAIGRNGRHVGA